MALKENCMMVNLSLSAWSARKYDRKASKEVTKSNNASDDAGRFNKQLIESEAIKKITKHHGSVRTWHYDHTSPWNDGGERLLPAKMYFDYMSFMASAKAEHEKLVDEFCREYPILRANARQMLGSLYNENDYPPEAIIREKFGFRFLFMPIADSSDFRVQIQEEEVKKIRESIEEQVSQRAQDTVNDLLNRLRDAVKRVIETLGAPPEQDAKTGEMKLKIFRDSLTGNICNLLEIVPRLNWSDDPHIAEVVQWCEPLCIDAQLIRDNPDFRAEILERARHILPKI